jgi:hypothetical protein
MGANWSKLKRMEANWRKESSRKIMIAIAINFKLKEAINSIWVKMKLMGAYESSWKQMKANGRR